MRAAKKMEPKIGRGSVTRQQVISVATRMFAQKGYEGTSIEVVLLECGISKGALYHHFRNKEALFIAVLETVEARIVEHVALEHRTQKCKRFWDYPML